MSGELRVAVIGLGWAGEQHVEGYRRIPGVRVVALAGMEDERVRRAGEALGISALYRDGEELLAAEDLDAVSICTPNFLHARLGLMALERGLHVLTEKPMATSAAEARAMVDAATRRHRVLHVSFNHRERGDVRVLRRCIDEGRLGRIYHAKASWMRRRGIPHLGSWYTSKQMAGGGPLIDLGVHVLDMALHLMGEPQPLTVSSAVYAELGSKGLGDRGSIAFGAGGAFEVEDLATAFIRFEDGSTLQLEASWATHSSAGDDFGCVLYGTDGGAELKVLNYSWENTLRLFSDIGGAPAEVRPRTPRVEGHPAVVRRFVEAVRDEDPAMHTGAEGLQRALLVEACYRSAAEKREVRVDEVASPSLSETAGR